MVEIRPFVVYESIVDKLRDASDQRTFPSELPTHPYIREKPATPVHAPELPQIQPSIEIRQPPYTTPPEIGPQRPYNEVRT